LRGVTLVNRFHWLFYVFGIVLMVTAIQMIRDEGKDMQPETNGVLRMVKRWMPAATPFLATLVVIEASDLIFAVDSIPAVWRSRAIPLLYFHPMSLPFWACGRSILCFRV